MSWWEEDLVQSGGGVLKGKGQVVQKGQVTLGVTSLP